MFNVQRLLVITYFFAILGEEGIDSLFADPDFHEYDPTYSNHYGVAHFDKERKKYGKGSC